MCFYCNFPGPLADCHRLTQKHGQLCSTKAPITGPSWSCHKTISVDFLILQTSYEDTTLSANRIPLRSFGKVGEDCLGVFRDGAVTVLLLSLPITSLPWLLRLINVGCKRKVIPHIDPSVYFCSCLGNREGCWFHEIPIF